MSSSVEDVRNARPSGTPSGISFREILAQEVSPECLCGCCQSETLKATEEWIKKHCDICTWNMCTAVKWVNQSYMNKSQNHNAEPTQGVAL